MKKEMKIILISLTLLLFVSSCKKTDSTTNDYIKFPFDFTHYGVIPINSGIKEIHDTVGLIYKDFYFTKEGILYKVIEQYSNLSEIPPNDPIYDDTTFIYDNIVYNYNNQLIKIGNSYKSDVYSFQYNGNNLSKVTQKFIPQFAGDTTSLNRIFSFEFTSNNSGNFTSSIYNYSSCPLNRTYHYTQNKLDSISTINPISCSSQLLTTPSVQFFYLDDKIIKTKTLTNLANYNTDKILIYTNNKLTEIKQPNINIQGAPHTTFIYY